MNKRIKELAEQAGLQAYYEAQEWHIKEFANSANSLKKFARLIEADIAKKNKMLAYELDGVIIDTERENGGFDDVCLRTVKRVCYALHGVK